MRVRRLNLMDVSSGTEGAHSVELEEGSRRVRPSSAKRTPETASCQGFTKSRFRSFTSVGWDVIQSVEEDAARSLGKAVEDTLGVNGPGDPPRIVCSYGTASNGKCSRTDKAEASKSRSI